MNENTLTNQTYETASFDLYKKTNNALARFKFKLKTAIEMCKDGWFDTEEERKSTTKRTENSGTHEHYVTISVILDEPFDMLAQAAIEEIIVHEIVNSGSIVDENGNDIGFIAYGDEIKYDSVNGAKPSVTVGVRLLSKFRPANN